MRARSLVFGLVVSGLGLVFAVGGLGACATGAPSAGPTTGAGDDGAGEGEDEAAALPPRTRDQIAATLMTSRDLVEACYQRALARDPLLGGRLTVAIAIAADGAVTSATVIDDDLGSSAVSDCVVDVFSHLRFTPASASSTVNYPVTFATERGEP